MLFAATSWKVISQAVVVAVGMAGTVALEVEVAVCVGTVAVRVGVVLPVGVVVPSGVLLADGVTVAVLPAGLRRFRVPGP